MIIEYKLIKPIRVVIKRDFVTISKIGKLAKAGFFCFRCSTTLCKEGLLGIHKPSSTWFLQCPSCGTKPTTYLTNWSTKPTEGVGVTNSFTWYFSPNVLCEFEGLARVSGNRKSYSIPSFIEYVNRICHIQFHNYENIQEDEIKWRHSHQDWGYGDQTPQ